MDVDDVQNIAASPCPVVKTPSQCCDMESDVVTINGGTGKSNETRQANATQFTFSD
jgi:molybdopterin biosynthesis enzyme MoaB